MVNQMSEITHYTYSRPEKEESQFVCRHPYIASAVMAFCGPLVVLSGVFAVTMAVMLPISLVMGWI